MKKLLLILLILVVLVLSSCDTSEHTHSEYEQRLIEILEQQDNINTGLLIEIQELKIQLESNTHLNTEIQELQQQVNELEKMIELLLTENDYTLNENGDYITFEEIGIMLNEQVFDNFDYVSTLRYTSDNISYEITITSNDVDINELTALSMMWINEFQQYEFYHQYRDQFRFALKVVDEQSNTVERLQITFNTSFLVYREITTNEIINGAHEVIYVSYFTQPTEELIEQYLP